MPRKCFLLHCAVAALGLVQTFEQSALADGVTFTPIALSGQTAPGTGGLPFLSFTNAVINNSGQVAYDGVLEANGQLLLNRAVYTQAIGGAPQFIAREGENVG